MYKIELTEAEAVQVLAGLCKCAQVCISRSIDANRIGHTEEAARELKSADAYNTLHRRLYLETVGKEAAK